MSKHPADIDLDIAGVLEGTDKSSSVSFAWDYLRHYQTVLAPWRHEPINMIEVGVQQGFSLNLWRQYFTHAQIVGIDIDPGCTRHAGDRVAIETGSQEDPGFLYRVCVKYPPTIIIDDGSHLAHHIVYTFKRLFPMLEPGGVYIVEDMEFQFGRFGDGWLGNKSVSAPDYFQELARGRMANNTPISQPVWGDEQYIRDSIDSISFVGGAVAIHKRKPRDIAPALAWAGQYLGSIKARPDQYLRLAEYIIHHHGPLGEAEQAVRNALALSGPTAAAVRWLVEVLFRQERLDEAGDAAVELTKLAPDDHPAWALLAHVEQLRGRTGNQIVALEKAASVNPEVAHYQDLLSSLLQRDGEFARALVFAKNAVALNPQVEPWKRRVADLERSLGIARC